MYCEPGFRTISTHSFVYQALLDICHKVTKGQQTVRSGMVKGGSEITGGPKTEGKPFDAMNNIVANLLLNLTRYVQYHVQCEGWFTIIMTIVLCFVWYCKLPSD